MNRVLRICFCLAVAAISAAIADALVEGASNVGRFGPGAFTDRSTFDVIPILLLGWAFGLLILAARVRGLLGAQRDPRRSLLLAFDKALGPRVVAFLPLAFAIQILVLYSMETSEQYIVWGHTLGGTIWLGGPIVFSLAAHASVCLVVAFAVSRTIRSLAVAAVNAIALIRAFIRLSVCATAPTFRRHRGVFTFSRIALIFCTDRERAPPLRIA